MPEGIPEEACELLWQQLTEGAYASSLAKPAGGAGRRVGNPGQRCKVAVSNRRAPCSARLDHGDELTNREQFRPDLPWVSRV